MTASSPPQGFLNALTLDVEEAFHASAFEDHTLSPAQRQSRLAIGLETFLTLTRESKVTSTCFVVGAVASTHPDLIRALVKEGHELACHSHTHRRIQTMRPQAFREDLKRAKDTLESLTGVSVRGFRAPTWSITPQTLWALDILVETGFTWDSSIFPVHHDRYGIPGAPRFPYALHTPGGALIREYPPSTLALLGARLPVAGGGYLRLYPEAATWAAIGALNRLEHRPAVVYLHPWELDADQPRLTAERLRWWRHAVGISHMKSRLSRLLHLFRFGALRDVVPETLPLPSVRLASCSPGGT